MASAVDQAADEPAVGRRPSVERGRLVGLDGIRGLAALFVVLHHCWLLSFPGFPVNTGPAWTGWLLYGHLAVVVFITLSGFSLAVAPARSGWRVDGVQRFFRRRAWRILPPYWAALLLSLIIAWTVVPQPGGGSPTSRSVLVYGLLVQDVFGAPTPNGAFWSIAIEAQLYLVFPVLLLLLRRVGAVVLLVVATVTVVTIELLAGGFPLAGLLLRLTPQFAVLFAVGMVAAGVVSVGGRRWRGLPWEWLALAAAVPVFLTIMLQGSVWTVEHYAWVDLAIGPAAGLLLVSVSLGGPSALIRVLDTRPVRRLGSFSYSLYLTHAPLVVVVHHVVAPSVRPGVLTFLVTLAVAVPLTLAVALVFAAVFELPFQRHRSSAALLGAVRSRLSSALSRTP
ncbi:MAG TPA: acyltransferase [Pseudonocardiaceae bacterium]|jgi:peptidoglycan/LPS O-acetylase OafA/YrhL